MRLFGGSTPQYASMGPPIAVDGDMRCQSSNPPTNPSFNEAIAGQRRRHAVCQSAKPQTSQASMGPPRIAAEWLRERSYDRSTA